MLRLLATCAAVLLVPCAVASAQSPLERGAYLVDAVMGCDGCHTPRPKGNFDMARRFSGGSQVWDTPEYLVRGSNISSDPETGIGTWSVDDIKRLITEGKRPNGVPVAHQMPYPFYKILTPRDLDAVAVYVKAAAPVRNQVPAPVYRGHSHTDLIPGADKPFTDEMLKEPVKRGFYLANHRALHGVSCAHTGRQAGLREPVGTRRRPIRPAGRQPGEGLQHHLTQGRRRRRVDRAEIKRVLTHGVGRNGRPLVLQMQRQVYFAKMTDQDLDAIVAWVRTIPPLE